MSTRNTDIAAAAKARCTGPFGSTHIMKCERVLRIGFFFDGFARHLLKDMQTGRVSNIGKLFLAHPVDAPNQQPDPYISYRKSYISGLGEDYESDMNLTANVALGAYEETIKGIPEGIATDQASEAVKSLLEGRSWWERLKRDLYGLAQHPTSALKVFKEATIGNAMEAVSGVRDSQVMAQLFKTGVDTRIEGAITSLNKNIDEARGRGAPPIKRIELSVYGFDFGATLAKDFLHQLLERCLQKDGETVYQGSIPLVITFAGLFDMVNRSGTYIPGAEEVQPFSSAVGDGSSLPSAVLQALHLVAAHERRFYRRAHLLAGDNRDWREEFVPGVSEDLGGSLLPNEQRPSAELALVSLHRMYRAAFRAGVPFPHLEDLPNIDMKTAQLFTFNDHIQGKSADALSKHYQRAASTSVAQLKNLELGHKADFLGHTRLYIRWLAGQWREYQKRIRELGAEEDRLHASQFQQGSGWFGSSTESAQAKAKRQQRTATIQAEAKALSAEYGWLEEVDKEARSIQRNLGVYGTGAAGGQKQQRIWQVLLDDEWFTTTPSPLPKEAGLLFEHFVHDKLARNAVQRGLNSLAGQHYFDIRGFDIAEAS